MKQIRLRTITDGRRQNSLLYNLINLKKEKLVQNVNITNVEKSEQCET